MKVGIRFADNDFSKIIHAFMSMLIVPTFIERNSGHMITHLTSPMIVELFNTHVPYIDRFINWYCGRKNYFPYDKPILEQNPLSKYFIITEMEIYWDDKIDIYLNKWEGDNNSEFIWTNGKEVFIS